MIETFVKTLLINSAVFAALFVLAYLLRAALGRRLSPALSLALWAVLAVKLVLPFGFESNLSPLGWFARQPAAVQTTVLSQDLAEPQPPSIEEPPASSIQLPLPVASAAINQPTTQPSAAAAVQPGPQRTPAGPIPWTLWALLAWVSGALGMALWLGLGQLALTRRLRKTTKPPAQSLAVLKDCRRELGIRTSVKLRILPGGSPAIVGLLRPVVLLDEELGRNAAQLRPVLLHELSHHRHGDLWIIHGLNLLNVVYWFHPLVWWMSALVRRDLETRCDQRVLAAISREEGRGYVRTLLHFAGFGSGNSLRAALGMASGSRPMERRIRDMFRSRHSDRATRLVSLACAVLMGLTGILSACQPTPAKPAVVNKNDGKLEEAIHATETPAKPTAAAGDDSAAPTAQPTPFPAPASLKYDLHGVTENFVVQVDAPIEVPDTGVFPVVKATGDVFSQVMVDKVRETLLPGVALYQPTDVVSKEQLQTKIDSYNEQLADSIKGKYDRLIKDYKKILKDLLAQQAKAPDTVQLEPADLTLHFPDFDNNLLFMYGKEIKKENSYHYEWTPEALQKAKDDGYLGLLGITPYQSAGSQMSFKVETMRAGTAPRLRSQFLQYSEYHTQNYYNPVNQHRIDGLTPEAAQAQAQALLQKMGLPFSLVAATIDGYDPDAELGIKASHFYHLQYKRDVGTIPQNNYTRPRSAEEMPEVEQLQEEKIAINVDSNGIQSFIWNAPVHVLDVENPNVALLPFDQIKAIFDKQIVATYEARPKEDEEIRSQRLVIYKVSLTSMPVRVQNDPKVFRYVPVWDFCGKLIGKYANDYAKGTSDHYILNDQNERVVNGQGETLGDTQDMSFLTINAIDGSIIDRNKGY